MKLLVLHSRGYAGSGWIWPSFVVEAESLDAAVTSVEPYEDNGPGDPTGVISGARDLLKTDPKLSPIEIARRTGGQGFGLIADAESGLLLQNTRDVIPEDERVEWMSLNDDEPDYEDDGGEEYTDDDFAEDEAEGLSS